MDEYGRTSPCDIQAEISLLGSLLIDNSYTTKIVSLLLDSDFYDVRHVKLFRAIRRLWSQTIPQDLVTVTDELVRMGELENIGGRGYLIEVTEDVYSAANCERYAEIIREKAVLREVLRLTDGMASQAEHQTSTLVELSETAKELYTQILRGMGNSNELIMPSSLQARRESDIAQYLATPRVLTGFRIIDKRLTYGYAPRMMSAVTAFPSVGKSTWKSNQIMNLCEAGYGVLSVATEQGSLIEQNRLDSSMLQIPIFDLAMMRTWSQQDERHERLRKNAEYIASKWKYYLLESCSMTVPKLEVAVETLLANGKKLDWIVLDLFDRFVDVDFSSAGGVKRKLVEIENIAKNTGTHITLLVQQHRVNARDNPNKIPRIDGMKWSGSFEEMCRLIFLLWREGRMKDTPDVSMDVIIGKQSDGYAHEAYMHRLGFDPEILALYDLDEDAEPHVVDNSPTKPVRSQPASPQTLPDVSRQSTTPPESDIADGSVDLEDLF